MNEGHTVAIWIVRSANASPKAVRSLGGVLKEAISNIWESEVGTRRANLNSFLNLRMCPRRELHNASCDWGGSCVMS